MEHRIVEWNQIYPGMNIHFQNYPYGQKHYENPNLTHWFEPQEGIIKEIDYTYKIAFLLTQQKKIVKFECIPSLSGFTDCMVVIKK